MTQFFCGEFYIQSWTVDGPQFSEVKCCVNVDHINAVQPYLADGELQLVVSFNWQNDEVIYTLRGENAKRFLNSHRISVPLDWLSDLKQGQKQSAASRNATTETAV